MLCSHTPSAPARAGWVRVVAILSFLAFLATPSTAQKALTRIESGKALNVAHDGAGDVNPWPDGDMPIGTGAAWVDYDGDGDLDLYVSNRGGANWLWRNDGADVFVDVAVALGADLGADHRSSGVAVADYDNDGDKDIYIAGDAEDVLLQNQLVESGTASFVDVTASAGLTGYSDRRGTTPSWGDFNADGWLDLYVANHASANPADMLFANDGDGTFTDVSSRIATDANADGNPDNSGFGFVAAWTDFDLDGDLDIYLLNDCPFGIVQGFGYTEDNKLWRNDGGSDPATWVFTEVSDALGLAGGGKFRSDIGATVPDCQNSMGIAIGDYDHDLSLDYYYTNLGTDAAPASATLIDNDSGVFTRAEGTAGVDDQVTFELSGQINPLITWGALFFDMDLDGDEDLYVAAGALMQPDWQNNLQPNLLYENNGDGTFTDHTTNAVETYADAISPRRTRTIIRGDFDGDGDADLFVQNYDDRPHLIENTQATGNHWLIVDLEGAGAPLSNRDGIGAKVYVHTTRDLGGDVWEPVRRIAEVHSGTSLGGGDDVAAYFGLGMEDNEVVAVTVEWPSGIVQTMTDVQIDSRIVIREKAPAFANVTADAGLDVAHGAVNPDMPIGTGAAWFDFDGDGHLDLYMTNRTGANYLWRNNGDGTFTDQAADYGVQDAANDGSGVSAADYDNDGDLDLFLANSSGDKLFQNRLVESGVPGFLDVTVAAGFETGVVDYAMRRGQSASWGDYDNDGWLDLYVANHMSIGGGTFSSRDQLWRNNGDGTFTDATGLLTVDVPGDEYRDVEGFGFIAGWTDVDMDGDLDIYLQNDCPLGDEGNKLWLNDGLAGGGTDPATDWVFTEASVDMNADICQNAMGLASGDYDNDGDQDYFFTNLGSNEEKGGGTAGSATLMRNDADGLPGFDLLTDVTIEAGLFQKYVPGTEGAGAGGASRIRTSWGAVFFDYDLDGVLDLAVATGTLAKSGHAGPDPGMLYRGLGDGTFEDVSSGSNVDDWLRTRSMAMADYDGDGDGDLFLVNIGETVRLLENTTGDGGNWLIVDLEGGKRGIVGPSDNTSNRDGIGAKVYATIGGQTQYWEVRSGSSLGGGDDIAAYFGLGAATVVDELRIVWPSGTEDVFASVPAGSRMTVEEGESIVLPVELAAFTAAVDGDRVTLQWTTASEDGSARFDVERRVGGSFETLGSLPAAGTTQEPQTYRFTTPALAPGRHTFRLRQVDLDGRVGYSPEIEARLDVPGTFLLSEAYPNPFNPTTSFDLAVREAQDVRIDVYDVVGRRVAQLFDGRMEANQAQTFSFDAGRLGSGLYFIRVVGDRFAEMRKVTLLK